MSVDIFLENVPWGEREKRLYHIFLFLVEHEALVYALVDAGLTQNIFKQIYTSLEQLQLNITQDGLQHSSKYILLTL